jgi:hypothetical protein
MSAAPRRGPSRRALGLLGLLLGAPPALAAPARPAPAPVRPAAAAAAAPSVPAPVFRDDTEAQLARTRTDFEFGKFAEALARAEDLLEGGSLTDAQRLELHQLAGLAAFNEEQRVVAERHLRAVLRLDPDHALDPFRVPPPAITFFDRLRDQMAGELTALREETRRRQERARREAEARERERAEVEALRARVDALAGQVTARTLERRSVLVNFLPFGAGQFQQERQGLGTTLAVSQGALAAVSVLAYVTRGTLRVERTEIVNGRLGEEAQTRTVWQLPAGQVESDQRLTAVQFAAAAGFFAAWLIGAADALVNHTDLVPVSGPLPGPAAAAAPAPGATLDVQPLPGGASAGVTLRF